MVPTLMLTTTTPRRPLMPTITTSWPTFQTTQKCAQSRFLRSFAHARAQDIELVHARLASIDNLRLDRFAPYLKRLCLRENFLSALDTGVFNLLTKLEELDFYDNKLKSVGDALNTMSELTCVISHDRNFCYI
jgi:hypothetical protein